MSSPTPQSLEHLFAGLNRRQTMLLLTTVTFGGQDAAGLFDFLPDSEAELFKHRAAELLQIPSDRRIPLLVQEIKRLVTAKRGRLWAADAVGVAMLLSKERPGLVEVVLRALPATLAESVRAHLPARQVKLAREIKPEVLDIIRWKLEEQLARQAPRRGIFKFSDVLLLQSRELFTVCDRLGARSLAQALAGSSDATQAAFFGALPPDLKSMVERATGAAAERALGPEDAQAVLELHGLNEKTPSEVVRSAGTQRLVRACLAQSSEFAARVLERHRGEFGQLFARWLLDERPKAGGLGDGGRADIVAELERLEQKGIINRPIRLPPPPRKGAPLGSTSNPSGSRPKPAPVDSRSSAPKSRPGSGYSSLADDSRVGARPKRPTEPPREPPEDTQDTTSERGAPPSKGGRRPPERG